MIPGLQMIPDRKLMIPKLDREWSWTGNGPQIGPPMIPDRNWSSYWIANDRDQKWRMPGMDVNRMKVKTYIYIYKIQTKQQVSSFYKKYSTVAFYVRFSKGIGFGVDI